MLKANYVVYLTSKIGVFLMYQAVFTSVTSAIGNELAEAFADIAGHSDRSPKFVSQNMSASACLCQAHYVFKVHVEVQLGLLIGRQAGVLLPVDKVGDTSLRLVRRPKLDNRARGRPRSNKLDHFIAGFHGIRELPFTHSGITATSQSL